MNIQLQTDVIPDLRDALRELIQAYVRLIATGHDRIVALGGDCDSAEIITSGDPYLRRARKALADANAEVERHRAAQRPQAVGDDIAAVRTERLMSGDGLPQGHPRLYADEPYPEKASFVPASNSAQVPLIALNRTKDSLNKIAGSVDLLIAEIERINSMSHMTLLTDEEIALVLDTEARGWWSSAEAKAIQRAFAKKNGKSIKDET